MLDETPRQIVTRILKQLEVFKSIGARPTFPGDFHRRLSELHPQVGRVLQKKISVWLVELSDNDFR